MSEEAVQLFRAQSQQAGMEQRAPEAAAVVPSDLESSVLSPSRQTDRGSIAAVPGAEASESGVAASEGVASQQLAVDVEMSIDESAHGSNVVVEERAVSSAADEVGESDAVADDEGDFLASSEAGFESSVVNEERGEVILKPRKNFAETWALKEGELDDAIIMAGLDQCSIGQVWAIFNGKVEQGTVAKVEWISDLLLRVQCKDKEACNAVLELVTVKYVTGEMVPQEENEGPGIWRVRNHYVEVRRATAADVKPEGFKKKGRAGRTVKEYRGDVNWCKQNGVEATFATKLALKAQALQTWNELTEATPEAQAPEVTLESDVVSTNHLLDLMKKKDEKAYTAQQVKGLAQESMKGKGGKMGPPMGPPSWRNKGAHGPYGAASGPYGAPSGPYGKGGNAGPPNGYNGGPPQAPAAYGPAGAGKGLKNGAPVAGVMPVGDGGSSFGGGFGRGDFAPVADHGANRELEGFLDFMNESEGTPSISGSTSLYGGGTSSSAFPGVPSRRAEAASRTSNYAHSEDEFYSSSSRKNSASVQGDPYGTAQERMAAFDRSSRREAREILLEPRRERSPRRGRDRGDLDESRGDDRGRRDNRGQEPPRIRLVERRQASPDARRERDDRRGGRDAEESRRGADQKSKRGRGRDGDYYDDRDDHYDDRGGENKRRRRY
ncbi:unnamed protein product [Amoebophrya sp. A25]|nr:unnamed protein product [Amoebophrya sp. A25]|eukprot:GSA25T00000763001.1